jgi:hypothetical protein
VVVEQMLDMLAVERVVWFTQHHNLLAQLLKL